MVQGEGTRGGTGKCKCDKGYVGLLCRKCDANFFASVENDTSIECTGQLQNLIQTAGRYLSIL